jgi:hypothetical protein
MQQELSWKPTQLLTAVFIINHNCFVVACWRTTLMMDLAGYLRDKRSNLKKEILRIYSFSYAVCCLA